MIFPIHFSALGMEPAHKTFPGLSMVRYGQVRDLTLSEGLHPKNADLAFSSIIFNTLPDNSSQRT